MKKRLWISTSPILFLLLAGIAIPSFHATQSAWAANCEPTDAENRPSIEELVGPLEEKPQARKPGEDQAKQEQTLAERREKQVREAREAAIDRLTAKLQTSLDDPNLWLSRARIRAQINQREGAIVDLTQFMKLKGKSAEQLAERGKLYYSLNQFDKAEADLNEAVQLEPDNPEILFARGKLYIDQWKTQQAYGDFSKVIAMQPKHKMARYNRAYLLMSIRMTEDNSRQAVEDLQTVIDMDPDWVLARYHYVRLLRALGRYEEVIPHANFVIWHEPDSECMYLYRSSAYRNLDKFDLALQDATKYIEFNPRDESRILTRALLYSRMKEHEKAIDDWKHYLKILPDYIAGHYQLAESYAALKRYDEAIAVHDKLMQLEPENSDWLRNRARLKADAGDFQGALADVTTSIDMGATNYHDRANVYREMGEHAKAWADDVYQTTAVKAFVGRSKEYEQELIEEEKDLIVHVEQQLKLLEAGEKLTRRKAFRPHNEHFAWGGYWLEGLTSLVTSDDVEKQKIGVQGFRYFVDNVQVCPIPPKETQSAVNALTKFAAGKHPKPLKFEARVLAQALGVLQVANDPKVDATQPGCLHFKRFEIAKDQQGRYRKFFHTGIEWVQHIAKDHAFRFREIRRTPQFIEMYDLNRGIWIRLEADQAIRSFNHKDWEFIAMGEITER